MTTHTHDIKSDQPTCLVVQAEDPVTFARLRPLLPQTVPYVPPKSSFRDAEPVIRAASAKHGLVLCDARIHFDRAEVESWPERLAGQGVQWLSIGSYMADLDCDPRARRFVLHGLPRSGTWGAATLILDRYLNLPPTGLRLISEFSPGGSDDGWTHPISAHLLRSDNGQPLSVARSRAGETDQQAQLRFEQHLSEYERRLTTEEAVVVHLFGSEHWTARDFLHRLWTVTHRNRSIFTMVELRADRASKEAQ